MPQMRAVSAVPPSALMISEGLFFFMQTIIRQALPKCKAKLIELLLG
jgi:hypothetical protein